MLSLLIKTFEQIFKNGEQIQNVYNIYKMWRTNSKCGELFHKCLYIREFEHVGEGFN